MGAAFALGAWAGNRSQAGVQRHAGARNQLAAAGQIEDVVLVAAVGCAAAHRDKPTLTQPAQVIGDEALPPAGEAAQLTDPPIAARQLA